MMRNNVLLAALGLLLLMVSRLWAAEPWREGGTGLEFVHVGGGCYQMGQDPGEREELDLLMGSEGAHLAFGDELPVREVCVGDFNLGRHEVTVAAFGKFVEATAYRTEAELGGGCQEYLIPRYRWDENPLRNWREPGFGQKVDEPVVCVSWNDAKAFADWLNKNNPGKNFRPATEAEWEFVARDGGQIKKFDEVFKLDDQGWHAKNSPRRTSVVGRKKAGALGAFDLYGNVWEWVGDYYARGAYATAGKNNQSGPAQGDLRVVRGGGWNSSAWNCRAANRDHAAASHRDTNLGFRLVYTGK